MIASITQKRANYLVIGRPGGSLDALVAAEEEVVLSGMGDVGVDGCSGGHVAGPPGLVPLVHAEEPGVVALLHCDQGDPWHVVRLKLEKKVEIKNHFVKMFDGGTLTQASRICHML